MSKRRGPPAHFDDVEALFRDPALYLLGNVIPPKGPAGAPRHYPSYMWIAYLALISVFRSARQVEAELGNTLVWDLVCRVVREEFPHDPDMWLPDKPMRRHHFTYAREYLDSPEVQERLQVVFREIAVARSRLIGLLDPNGPGSFTHPARSRLIHADGKVITPLYRGKRDDTRVDKRTGEIANVRHDPSAKLFVEGDGKSAWGNRFVLAAVRTRDDRVILDWAPAQEKGEGGEAGVAVEVFSRLSVLAPGAQGIVYDMAIRGTHISSLMREQGLLPLVRVAAKVNPWRRRNRAGAKRVEKEAQIEVRRIDMPDGSTKLVPLHARGGALGIYQLKEEGSEVFVPLRRVRTQRFRDKSGRFRWYNQHVLPEEYGGREITVRYHETDDDKKRNLKRAENLRAIPPSDPDFPPLYARRNDAESINRAIEDSLYLGRAHSVGSVRQQTDLLGWALLINARTLARHRARGQPTAAA